MKVEFIRETPEPPPLKEVVLRLNQDEYLFLKQLVQYDWSCLGTGCQGAARRWNGLLNATTNTPVINYDKCFK
jgi:hypothetical protein